MRRYRSRTALVGALALTSMVGGCGFAGDDADGDTAGGGAKEVKVGFIGPLTGEYEVYGGPSLKSVQLATEEWNRKGGVLGKKITVVRGDSQGDPKQAATLARRFVDQGIEVVVGPTFSLEAETAVPIFCDNEITAVTGFADLIDPKGSPCYFRASPREDTAAEFASRLMLEHLKAKRVALIDDGKSDTVRTNQFVEKSLKGKTDIVFSGSVTAGKQDYSSTLTKIKSLKPDVIFVGAVLPESGILRKQGTDLGIDAQWLLSFASSEPAFRKLAGERGTPSLTSGPAKAAGFGKFAESYEQRFKEDPSNLNQYTYDAANILYTAIQNAKSLESAKLLDELKALKAFPGVTGPITFDETGSRGTEVFETLQYGKDQKWTKVESVPFDQP